MQFYSNTQFTQLIIYFSAREGKGVIIAPDTVKNQLMSKYHLSKDITFSFFSSFVIPKGSPLKVS